MDYEGLTPDDLANVRALNRTWLRLTGRNERLAGAPFLLFSFRERDHGLWERLLDESSQSDLFAADSARKDEMRDLQISGLAFLWELARRNPYVARIVSGAPLQWCDRVASETLVRVLACAGRSIVIERRFAADAPVYKRLSAHMAALQSMLTSGETARFGRLPAAACRISGQVRVASRRPPAAADKV